jgi:PAS domain S-box-containing protein
MNRAIYIRRKRPPGHHHPYFEEALQKSQQVLRQFVQTLPVAICILDRHEQTYLDINDRFAEMAGLSRAEILTRRCQDLPAGLSQPDLDKILAKLVNGESVEQMPVAFAVGEESLCGTVRAELIEYGGREGMLVTFVETCPSEHFPQPAIPDSRLAIAGDIGRSLADTVDLEEVYRRLSGSIFQMLPDVSAVFISLFEPAVQRIRVVYASHNNQTLDPAQFREQVFGACRSDPQSEALRTRRALIVNDLKQRLCDPSLNLPVAPGGRPASCAVLAPMIAKGEVIGVIQAHSIKPARFQQADASLLSLISNTAAIAVQNIRLAQNLEQTSQDLAQTYEATIEGWTRALLLRDSITESHTHRVIGMTVELGKRLGLQPEELVQVKRGAQLHDIGKIGIEDKILRKNGPLDEDEWREMRKHPLYAYELLRPIPRFNQVLDIPYCHHEKWDGSGYPRRLKGEDIPLSARIFSIVDVWDALSSNRPYRRAWPQSRVVAYIESENEKHFEPVITSAFLELIRGKNHVPRPPGALVRGTSTTFFLK